MLLAAAVCFLLALLPAGMFFGNLRLFKPAPRATDGGARSFDAAGYRSARDDGARGGTAYDTENRPAVSVLIPARDEEAGIAACVESVLANEGVDLDVLVLDDHSTDRTAEIVQKIAAKDPRVRVESAPPLPDGWCGKQHACFELSRRARHDFLLFIDADVRLGTGAVRRAVAFMDQTGAGLVSGFPRQETGTLLEKLLLPLIHFVLLGFLPVGRMRASPHPAYGAGCGQFFLARRDAYGKAGGHAAIKASLHDGVTLPRAFRRSGSMTDLFDATDVATCRMYRGAGQTWRGLAKNATEGMASPRAIVPWTVLLLGGQVAPVFLLAAGIFTHRPAVTVLSAAALLLSYIVRLAAAARFRQSILGAALHPLGVLLLVAVQWWALIRHLAGMKPQWRGRSYATGATAG